MSPGPPRLSVNVNKIATVRNSRGGSIPSVPQAVDVCIAAGAPGITVHPRADERHIRRDDVYGIAAHLASRRDRVEFNIEGDPRPDFLAMVLDVLPHQCTLVPVLQGEITSPAGWSPESRSDVLRRAIDDLRAAGTCAVRPSCWAPITQPRITPKAIPATVKTTASSLML